MGNIGPSFLHRLVLTLFWRESLEDLCPGLIVPTFSFFGDTGGTFAGHGLGHPGHDLKNGCFWRSKMRTWTQKSAPSGHESKHVIFQYNYHELR
jgi:hypothetical protein